MGEELDPSLEPVLAKAFVKRGNAILIKLGDKEIDFNPDFRLYITTKLGALPYAMFDASIRKTAGAAASSCSRIIKQTASCMSLAKLVDEV